MTYRIDNNRKGYLCKSKQRFELFFDFEGDEHMGEAVPLIDQVRHLLLVALALRQCTCDKQDITALAGDLIELLKSSRAVFTFGVP